MSLQTRLEALITAIGTDVKNLLALYPREPIQFVMSGTLTTKVGDYRVYMDKACTVDSVTISVNTAPSGGTVIVDVNRNGTTIYGTQTNRPTIASTGFTANGGAASNGTFAAGDYLTVDVDAVTAPAANLTVYVRMRRTA